MKKKEDALDKQVEKGVERALRNVLRKKDPEIKKLRKALYAERARTGELSDEIAVRRRKVIVEMADDLYAVVEKLAWRGELDILEKLIAQARSEIGVIRKAS